MKKDIKTEKKPVAEVAAKTNEEKASRVVVEIEDLREVTGGLKYCDTIMCAY